VKSRTRWAWIAKGALAGALLLPLAFGLSGCWLLDLFGVNILPVAAFTMSALSGQAPLTVSFSAVLSYDEDGEIESWAWDFGDGTDGTGRTVEHRFDAAGTRDIVLTVTDDQGGSARAQKTLYVLPPEPPGPVARFTASPTSGTSPLTVQFDASTSTYSEGTISSYEWAFGDGRLGYGDRTSNTYISAGAQTYTVTLTVRASDGKTATATAIVSVTVPGATPTAGAPSARFTVDRTIGIAPLQVHLDPVASEAAEGRTLILYTWSFGDGSALSDIGPTIQEHVYTTNTTSTIFSATLLVLDNQAGSDQITKTIKAYNHRPVAGFEIGNPPGGDAGAGVVHYLAPALPTRDYLENDGQRHRDMWCPRNVVYGNLGALQTVSVVIRSMEIPDPRWRALTNTGNQATLKTASGASATSSTAPGGPTGYHENNLSYDPEGQEWTAGNVPAWFPNQAWGIRYLYIDWGDTTPTERLTYNAFAGGDIVAHHIYAFPWDGKPYTITMTAEDWLGHRSAPFSRTVTLKKAAEGTSADL